MSLILTALVVSVILIAVLGAVARSRLGIGGASTLSGVGVLIFFVMFSPALTLQCLLTCLAGLLCRKLQTRPKTFVFSAVGAAVASFALAIGISVDDLHERKQFRAEYPLVSVADRLQYEAEQPTAVSEDETSEAESELSPEVQQRLERLETRPSSNMRRYMLESLHSRTRDQFVLARGFGPVRMLGVRRERVELPEPEPIPLPPRPETEERYIPDATPPAPMASRSETLPSPEDLMSLHEEGLFDFLDRGRMGYVKDRQHVAGFQSHHFRKLPRLSHDEASDWQITRLELISLLKHEMPVAYVSEHLPRMDQLKDVPTRRLDAFEQNALRRIRSEDDLVVDEDLNRIRMVGSLRAGNDCLQCHLVERGDLLGAFSYDLHRVGPVEPTKREVPVGPQARWQSFGDTVSMIQQP